MDDQDRIRAKKESLNQKSDTTNTESETTELIKGPKYTLYPMRWVICIFFTTSVIASGLAMVGMSAITPIISEIYGVGGITTSMLVLPFIILFIPCIFPANYLIDHHGISIPVYWASATLLVGAWIRLLVNTNFNFVIVGQVIMALGQPFMLSAPAKLAALWFGDNERAIATTLGSLAAPIGAVTGFLLPLPLISDSDAEKPAPHGENVFFRYLLIQNIIITVLGLPIIFFVRNQPPSPPSSSAAKVLRKKSPNQCRSIGKLFKNIDFIFLLLSFSFIYSIYTTLGAAVGSISENFGYSTSTNSIFGTVYIFGGLFGSFLHAFALDKYQKYKLQYCLIGVGCVISMGAITAAIGQGSTLLTAILLFFLGLAQLPIIGVSYSFCAELTYPINEALSCGMLQLAGSIFATILTFTVGILLDNGYKYPAVLLMWGSVTIGAFLQLFVREILRRKRAGLKSSSFSFNLGNQSYMNDDAKDTNGLGVLSKPSDESPLLDS